MLAPSSGKKTRKKIMKQASGVRNQFSELVSQGDSMVDDAKKTAQRASAQASKAVNHTIDEAKSSFEHAKNATVKA